MNPREDIELLIEAALLGITTGDYDVVRSIKTFTRKLKTIDQVPAGDRPAIVLQTQEHDGEVLELGSTLTETPLEVSVMVYDTIVNAEDGASICNRYAEAVRRCLMRNRGWGGLAMTTRITSVPQHSLLNIPDAITTVIAEVRYLHIDEDEAA